MIELHELSKTYHTRLGTRQVRALDGLTLSIARGEVIGIAGPNGAGKSTLISLLLGFIFPTAGTAKIDGLRPRAYVERHGIGYLPELLAVPRGWTVEETVRRSATLSRIDPATIPARTAQMLEQLGLDDQRQKHVRHLSKGNLQRLGLALTLIGDHELVILDEPTYGLDPIWTQRFRTVVGMLRRSDRAIVIASHNLDELERLADRVIILHGGRLQRIVGEHSARPHGRMVTYRLALGAPCPVSQVFQEVTAIEGRANEWRVSGEIDSLNRSLHALLAEGATVLSFTPEESRLEHEFRMAMGGAR